MKSTGIRQYLIIIANILSAYYVSDTRLWALLSQPLYEVNVNIITIFLMEK